MNFCRVMFACHGLPAAYPCSDERYSPHRVPACCVEGDAGRARPCGKFPIKRSPSPQARRSSAVEEVSIAHSQSWRGTSPPIPAHYNADGTLKANGLETFLRRCPIHIRRGKPPSASARIGRKTLEQLKSCFIASAHDEGYQLK